MTTIMTRRFVEGISCVKVVGRRVEGVRCMRDRRVLGGTGIGTMEWHVASASTPIPHCRLATTPCEATTPHHALPHHSGSCHRFDGSHVCHHTYPPPLLGTHTVGDIWWQSYPPMVLESLYTNATVWVLVMLYTPCHWCYVTSDQLICPSLF